VESHSGLNEKSPGGNPGRTLPGREAPGSYSRGTGITMPANHASSAMWVVGTVMVRSFLFRSRGSITASPGLVKNPSPPTMRGTGDDFKGAPRNTPANPKEAFWLPKSSGKTSARSHLLSAPCSESPPRRKARRPGPSGSCEPPGLFSAKRFPTVRWYSALMQSASTSRELVQSPSP
jgi:hypothetical protein